MFPTQRPLERGVSAPSSGPHPPARPCTTLRGAHAAGSGTITSTLRDDALRDGPHTSENPRPMEIWINPNCSKCRSALSQLDAEGASYTVRRYLDDPPTEDELRLVLDRLGLEPWDITRTGEPAAAELGIASWERTPAHRDHWIRTLAAHPVLIQRPIITQDDGTAVIGRSAEAIRALLA